MTLPTYATCPVCGRNVALKLDGTLRAHQATTGHGRKDPSPPRCPCSNLRPSGSCPGAVVSSRWPEGRAQTLPEAFARAAERARETGWRYRIESRRERWDVAAAGDEPVVVSWWVYGPKSAWLHHRRLVRGSQG